LILVIALVPLSLAGLSSIGIESKIRDNLIAANLVKEGIEVVRSIRDANWYSVRPFNFNLDTCSVGVSCRVQWDSVGVMLLGSNPPLRKDGAGVYNYSTGTDTIFRRIITITQMTAVELRVESEVYWLADGVTMTDCTNANTRCIKAELHLYDWF